MATELSGSIKAVLNLLETKDIGDLGEASFPLSLTKEWKITDGTGSGQADILYADSRTLAASADEDLDLAGVLSDIFGATIAAAKIRAIYIYARAENPHPIVLTSDGSAGVPLFKALGDGIQIPAGATFLLVAPLNGFPVTATTGDLLNVAAGADDDHVYDIIVLATSA